MYSERCERYAKIAEDQQSHLYAEFSEAFNSLKRRLDEIGKILHVTKHL